MLRYGLALGCRVADLKGERMGIYDKEGTPEWEHALVVLMKDNGGCRTSAEVRLKGMMTVPKRQLERLIARKAWADPRNYDAAVEAVKLKE